MNEREKKKYLSKGFSIFIKIMSNRGEETEQEVIMISLDSDDEEDERGVPEAAVSLSEAETTSQLIHGIFGDTLDVNKLSEPVLRSIVASIVKVQPKPCETCIIYKTTIQKLEDEQKVDRAKLKLLEEENTALKTELEKEKEERKQLEDKLEQIGRNVVVLEEVTGNIRSLMGQLETEEEPETPAQSQEIPPPSQEVHISYVPLTCPPRLNCSPPVQHAVDKSKSHLGTFCTCGLQFDSLNKMYTHAKRMLNESFVKAKFSCTQCPKTFLKFVSLKHHTEVKHGLKYAAGVVGCHYCGQVFHTRVKLLYHQRMTHKGGHFRFLNLYRSQSMETEATQETSQTQEYHERMELEGPGELTSTSFEDDDDDVLILDD